MITFTVQTLLKGKTGFKTDVGFWRVLPDTLKPLLIYKKITKLTSIFDFLNDFLD